MEIWIKQDENELRLPILPSSYNIEYSMDNKSVSIVNLGELNLIGYRNLTTVAFDTIFPKTKYPFCQYNDFPSPEKCKKNIIEMMDSREPVRLIITGANINMLATIESLGASEDDGTGDIKASFLFKKYVKTKIPKTSQKEKTKSSKKIKKPSTKRNTKKIKTMTYIVKNNDTLMSIAKKLTGDADNYRAIANQNGIKDINRIRVGMKLVIKV